MSSSGAYQFTLYVAGDAQNSARAIANLSALCNSRLAGRYEVELVDVFKDPERALDDGIFLTPTLVRTAPGPTLRIVGTLAETQTLLEALGLEDAAA
jgi:circadian clock protein KaiB